MKRTRQWINIKQPQASHHLQLLDTKQTARETYVLPEVLGGFHLIRNIFMLECFWGVVVYCGEWSCEIARSQALYPGTIWNRRFEREACLVTKTAIRCARSRSNGSLWERFLWVVILQGMISHHLVLHSPFLHLLWGFSLEATVMVDGTRCKRPRLSKSSTHIPE